MAVFQFIVVVITITAYAMAAPEIPEQWKQHAKLLHDKCQADTGVTEDHIVDANNGKFAEDNVLKCYMKCLMVQSMMMSEDGVFDYDATIALIPDKFRETLIPTVNKCKSVVGSDACGTAFLMHKCFYDNNPELYILI